MPEASSSAAITTLLQPQGMWVRHWHRPKLASITPLGARRQKIFCREWPWSEVLLQEVSEGASSSTQRMIETADKGVRREALAEDLLTVLGAQRGGHRS